MSSSWPTFTDEIAFASDPFDDPQVWTTLPDGVVEERTVSRGRQSEYDDASTGTAALTLLDDDRTYDPENTGGAHYPNVLPMRRMRCQATLDGTTYDVFNVFIDVENGWQREETTPSYAKVNVPGNDGFDVLGTHRFDGATTFPAQKTGERIEAILDQMGWPAADRDIDAGQEDMQEITAAGGGGANAGHADTDALSLIREAEATEPGYFFFDSRGFACFHDRQRRLQPPYTVSQATFFDGSDPAVADAIARILLEGGGWLTLEDGSIVLIESSVSVVAYEKLTVRRSRIVNDWRIAPANLDEQTAQDATSISRFRQRDSGGSVTTMHTTEAAALASGNWRLSQTKDTYERFEELRFPLLDSGQWTQALARKIGDRITIIRTPPGGSTAESKDCHIEAVNLEFGPGPSAYCTYRLSPAAQTDGWMWNTSRWAPSATGQGRWVY